MVALKKIKGILLVLAILLVVGIVLYLLVTKIRSKVVTKPTQQTAQVTAVIKKSREESLKRDISDPQTLAITLLLEDKKYDEIIVKAKQLCHTLQGNNQAICYSTYAQALMGTGDLKTLVIVADEALKTDVVKANESYTASWQQLKASALQGKNPLKVNKTEDQEARK